MVNHRLKGRSEVAVTVSAGESEANRIALIATDRSSRRTTFAIHFKRYGQPLEIATLSNAGNVELDARCGKIDPSPEALTLALLVPE